MPNLHDAGGLQFGESLWVQIAKILLIRSIFGGKRLQKTSMKTQFSKQMIIRIVRVVQIEPLHGDDHHSDQNFAYLGHATPSLGVMWPDWASPLTTAV